MPIYEVINECSLPAVFHTGHSGMASGMRGSGRRLEYSNPMRLDDVAIDCPDMPIITAHLRFPWPDAVLRNPVCSTHKFNVRTDLSGWNSKYFPNNSCGTSTAAQGSRATYCSAAMAR